METIASTKSLIARGAGRSYGDAALNAQMTLLMAGSSRILFFDDQTGRLTCEAGMLLADILKVFVPRGWFLPVTPGTQYVTVGGMIASDVHGKNHHGAGSFGVHVESFDLAVSNGQMLRCAAGENVDLFNATIGGMGLTGVILRVTFRMLRIETDLILQETIRASNLGEAFDVLERSLSSTYSVAWIDSLAKGDRLGRAVVFTGEHLAAAELPKERASTPFKSSQHSERKVPFDFPGITLNRFSVSAFNAVYFASRKPGRLIVDYQPYFYPLDSISQWNRIYGRAGFVQYQVVFPREGSREAIAAILRRVSDYGVGSFLSVLKLCGRQRNGLLSFPREGYTLALDFPIRARTFSMLLELDRIVDDHDGRIYLAKDARMGARMFERGYPRTAEFALVRQQFDPSRKMRSVLSDRLGI
ncbi:FAD-binding oxidoreductase [Tardiphaga sp.]|uniref:FAD-binding oxidoreductase n=1 Tax=Tardiphaga sp. TaxID=1926292 RepID=UPI00260F7CC9|nr:FAD-binding oxidoreductase [Tardiphaga sp.]